MKIQIYILILLASSCFIFAEVNPVSVREYRVYQWTRFKSPKEKQSETVDPFSKKPAAAEAPHKKRPQMSSEETYILNVLDIEVAEENGTCFFFDGESIYARITELDHSKLVAAMETEGVEVSSAKELEILKLIEQRKQKINKSEDGNSH